MKHEVGWFIEPEVDSPSAALPGPRDARRKALELLAHNLADLGEAVANLGDEPLAALLHDAWQRAASLLLKLPPADGSPRLDSNRLSVVRSFGAIGDVD